MNVTASIERFAQLIRVGMEAWIEAGRLVVEWIDRDPKWPEHVIRACPEISEATILAFERLGRGTLHPRLLASNAPGVRRLRGQSIEIQTRFVDAGLPLLVRSGSGWDTLLVSVWDLSRAQASQVFARDRVRTAEEQRAWLEEKRTKEWVAEVVDEPWQVVHGRLVVSRPCEFTASQVARMLEEMTK